MHSSWWLLLASLVPRRCRWCRHRRRWWRWRRRHSRWRHRHPLQFSSEQAGQERFLDMV